MACRGLVIFDLDGTLLDTLDDLTAAVNYALEAHGYPTQNRSAVQGFVGNGMKKLLSRAMGESNAPLAPVLNTFQEYYAAHAADATHPYPGIGEMLHTLRQSGVDIAVVSNKSEENVKALCTAFFGIEVAIGGRADLPHKPAPEGVWLAMRKMGATTGNTVYVGDSDVDVETARNARIPCISVTWGFRTEAELLEAGAECLVDTPAEAAEAALAILGDEAC